MKPVSPPAASLLPSEEEVMQLQSRVPAAPRSVHVAPLSVEVQMEPLCATAASLLPSAEEAMPNQSRTPAAVRSVHVAP